MNQFDQAVDAAYAAMWSLEPRWPVYLGKHEYDGRVPSMEPAEVDAVVRRLGALRERLVAMEGLDGEQEIDREQLVGEIDSTSFGLDGLDWWRRNPMHYVNLLDVTSYVSRNYAAPAARAEVVATALDHAPALLAQARANLEGVPAIYAKWGVTTATGLADFVEGDAIAALGELDAATASRLGESARIAAEELRAYAAWIESEVAPGAPEEFAIGEGAMEELLRRNELIDMPLADLLQMAEDDLAANQEAFRETAFELDPVGTPGEVYERHVAAVHPTADELIPATRDMLEAIRTFLVDNDIITVPSEIRALVAETPKHLRWAFAMMSTPGPYEDVAKEAYYYVTPVEPEWDAERAEEWLKALNTFALEDISIHETYPGHYVHFLHYQSAPTEVSRRSTSYAFTEGWAHYTEQMMWEVGYRNGDLRFRLAQLQEALVRNCRFVCALRMHARDMSVAEATQFFVDNAFYEPTPAAKEAERGTFDPGYFSYTLGKLQILRLRDDVRAAQGDAFVLKDFHDSMLSRGAPPVELMRKVLLGA